MLSLKSTLALLALTFAFISSNLPAEEQVKMAYAQLLSLKSQIHNPENPQNRIVKLEQIDGSQGVDVSTPDKVIIQETGIYFMLAMGEAGAEKTGDSGFVDIWFMKNGQPIPNSASRQSVSDSKLTTVILTQTIIPLKAGDSINLGFFANKASAGLIAFPAFQNEPNIPSIVFSIYKIGS